MLAVVSANAVLLTSVRGQSQNDPLNFATLVQDETRQPYVLLPEFEPTSSGAIGSLVVLPEGLIYRSYLAGVKESRMGAQLFNRQHDGALFDGTLGGRIGILRLGPRDKPLGYQVDVEGSAQVRLDPEEEVGIWYDF